MNKEFFFSGFKYYRSQISKLMIKNRPESNTIIDFSITPVKFQKLFGVEFGFQSQEGFKN